MLIAFSRSRSYFHTCSASCSQVKTHYETLGVSHDASLEEIRTAFLDLAKKYHPDRDPSNIALHSRFVEINRAYSILSKLPLRNVYDTRLKYNREIDPKVYYSPPRNYEQYDHDPSNPNQFNQNRQEHYSKQSAFKPYRTERHVMFVFMTLICIGAGYHFIRYRVLVNTRNRETESLLQKKQRYE